MTKKEIFATQWNKLKEEMVELMNFQLKNMGCFDYNELNRVYKSKMLRWSSQMQPEGRWLHGLEDGQVKQKMKDALSRLELSPVELEKSSPVAALASGAGVGVACAVTCNVLDVAKVLCGVGGVAGFAAAYLGVSQWGKAKHTEQAEAAKEAYLSQIAQAYEGIAAILEEV